jgi:hypothetical protein
MTFVSPIQRKSDTKRQAELVHLFLSPATENTEPDESNQSWFLRHSLL